MVGQRCPIIEGGASAKSMGEYIDAVIRSGEEKNSFVVTSLMTKNTKKLTNIKWGCQLIGKPSKI